ncbi:MAG: hypothetical protein U0610_17215 [bacterium]
MQVSAVQASSPLEPFVPVFDARERFQVAVDAPAALVYETATTFDMQSVGLVRAIFRLREIALGARGGGARVPRGWLEEAAALGWGTLAEVPGRLFVAGAHCQPWLPDVCFVPIAPAAFRGYSEPGQVKIAWTLEVVPLAASRSLLATETRVVATDPAARERFLRYWRWARFGIVPIRWLLLPAIAREANRRASRSSTRAA